LETKNGLWGDIDWTSGQILVRRTYNHGRFYAPKSKRSKRRVDLAPEMMTELKKWKLACPPSQHDLVFPSAKGTPMDATNLLRRQFLEKKIMVAKW
jgi:integrase